MESCIEESQKGGGKKKKKFLFKKNQKTSELERYFCISVISLGRQTGKHSVEQLPRLYSVFVLGNAALLTVRDCGYRAAWSCSLLQGSTPALWALYCAVYSTIALEFAHVVDSCGFLTMRWLV